MATFSETFLCTAVPAGIDGTKVRIAVLVSPRLMSDSTADAALSSWPAAQEWPAIDPDWTVVLEQGGRTATWTGDQVTELQAGAHDLATWRKLFPGDLRVRPYVPEDRAGTPIASYPVATTRDAIRDLHVSTLATARTEFPAVADLQDHEVFQALKEAVDPDTSLVHGAPRPDREASLAESFGMAELFHGVRPGSLGAEPSGVSVAPDTGPSWGGTLVTVTGRGFAAATRVRFGGADATELSVTSDTSLTCRTPAGTEGATVDVVVDSPSGSSAPGPGATFRYESPRPEVTGLDPKFSRKLTGVPVKIQGHHLLHATSVRFDRTAYPDLDLDAQRGAEIYEITRTSDEEITVQAPDVEALPKGPTGSSPEPAYHVVVTNVAGESSTSNADLFSYSHITVR